MMHQVNFSAYWFDGVSSEPKTVTIHLLHDQSLEVRYEGRSIARYSKGEYIYYPPVGKTSIRFRFPKSGQTVELPFSQDVFESLRHLSAPTSHALRKFESHAFLASGIFLIALIGCIALYIWGLPLLAKGLRPFIPHGVKELAGEQIVLALDAVLLHPSKLEEKRLEQIQKLSASLSKNVSFGSDIRTMARRFTEKDKDIINAFAILPRTIFITDGLVQSLSNEEIEAVIAHEIGHLFYDHGTVMLLRSSIVSVITLALFGADPGAVQGLALAMVQAQYSQEQELQADSFAVELLKSQGKDPKFLSSALSKISEGSSETELERYLSTHPLPSERIKAINKLATGNAK